MNATASIDLRGTLVAVGYTFTEYGSGGRGRARHSRNGQVMEIEGCGYQGGCGANGSYACLDNGRANDQWQAKAKRGQFRIPLVSVATTCRLGGIVADDGWYGDESSDDDDD